MTIFSCDNGGKSAKRRRRGNVAPPGRPRPTIQQLLLAITGLVSSCDSALLATRAGRSSLLIGDDGASSCYTSLLLLAGKKVPHSIVSSAAIRTAFRHQTYQASHESTSRLSAVTAAAASDGFLPAAFTKTTSPTPDTSPDASTERSGGVDKVFQQLDTDGSGAVSFQEFHDYLTRAGYSQREIEASFQEMKDFGGGGGDDNNNNNNNKDNNRNNEISRAAFERAIWNNVYTANDDCPRGYFLNSVQQACVPLGPMGRVSQRLETLPGPLQRTYKRIGNLFGLDTKEISKLGVSFALSYSIISNLNGAISLSVAWYISCKRVSTSLFNTKSMHMHSLPVRTDNR
jgi:EF hand